MKKYLSIFAMMAVMFAASSVFVSCGVMMMMTSATTIILSKIMTFPLIS